MAAINEFTTDYTTNGSPDWSGPLNAVGAAAADRYEHVVAAVADLSALSGMWPGMRVWVSNLLGTGVGGVATYNGSSWDYDTDWVTVPVASVTGLTATVPLQYLVKNGVIWLRGQLTYSSGFPNSGGYLTVATLPVAARPSQLARLGGATFQSTTARSPVINIGTDGVMTVGATGATFNDVYLNGIHYLPD